MNKKREQFVRILFSLLFFFFLVLSSHAGRQQEKPEVPYVPTPREVILEMLKKAAVGKNDVLYDLGCGDGRIVITAVNELGCRGVGIDIDPQRIKESRESAAQAGVSDRTKFIQMNLFEADIREATVVTLYLLSEVNLRLRPKLLQELRPGTRVVSHDFDMGAWNADDSTVIDGDSREYTPIHDTFWIHNYWNRHNVFLWIIPANVTGVWKWSMPEAFGKKRITMEIDQAFQEFEGKAVDDSSSDAYYVRKGKIRGNRLEFMLETEPLENSKPLHIEGVVRYNTLEGFVQVGGKADIKGKWKAKRDPETIKSIAK